MDLDFQFVDMRHYSTSEPMKLEKELTKVDGSKRVTVIQSQHLIRIWWNGNCQNLAKLEKVAAEAGFPATLVTHAHLTVGLKAGPNAALDTLKAKLTAIGVVRGLELWTTSAEIHVDLENLRVEDLRTAIKDAGYEGELLSHRWIQVTFKHDGDRQAALPELEKVQGIASLRMDLNAVAAGIWATKAVTDDALRKACERAKVKDAEISHP
jgi:D-aminopeptidase